MVLGEPISAGGISMYYDGWMADNDFDMAYDGAYDAYNPYLVPHDGGYYDPRYYKEFRYPRPPRPHPRYHRFRRNRRYW